MSTTEVGKTAPSFNSDATGEQQISLAQFAGTHNVVLYFYPKDSTSGCTTEGQDFRDKIEKFNAADTVILGASRDSLKSHDNFKTKQEFPFELLSDPEEVLCKAYDVIKEKNNFGKKYMGIERSTFLIGKDGKIAQEWRKVRVKGHVAEVLAAAEALNG